jgi:hypothetical protein
MWKEAKGRDTSTLALDLYHLRQSYTTFGSGPPARRPVEGTGSPFSDALLGWYRNAVNFVARGMLQRRRLVIRNGASPYFAMARCSYNLYGALIELRSLHTNPPITRCGRKEGIDPMTQKYCSMESTCINQQDIVEKTQQVAAMGDVYNRDVSGDTIRQLIRGRHNSAVA